MVTRLIKGGEKIQTRKLVALYAYYELEKGFLICFRITNQSNWKTVTHIPWCTRWHPFPIKIALPVSAAGPTSFFLITCSHLQTNNSSNTWYNKRIKHWSGSGCEMVDVNPLHRFLWIVEKSCWWSWYDDNGNDGNENEQDIVRALCSYSSIAYLFYSFEFSAKCATQH